MRIHERFKVKENEELYDKLSLNTYLFLLKLCNEEFLLNRKEVYYIWSKCCNHYAKNIIKIEERWGYINIQQSSFPIKFLLQFKKLENKIF